MNQYNLKNLIQENNILKKEIKLIKIYNTQLEEENNYLSKKLYEIEKSLTYNFIIDNDNIRFKSFNKFTKEVNKINKIINYYQDESDKFIKTFNKIPQVISQFNKIYKNMTKLITVNSSNNLSDKENINSGNKIFNLFSKDTSNNSKNITDTYSIINSDISCIKKVIN